MVGKSKILCNSLGSSRCISGVFGTFLFLLETGLFLENSVETVFAGGTVYPDLARIEESFRSQHRDLIFSVECVFSLSVRTGRKAAETLPCRSLPGLCCPYTGDLSLLVDSIISIHFIDPAGDRASSQQSSKLLAERSRLFGWPSAIPGFHFMA